MCNPDVTKLLTCDSEFLEASSNHLFLQNLPRWSQKFPACYGPRRFSNTVTRSCHWPLFEASWMHCIHSDTLSLSSILILSCFCVRSRRGPTQPPIQWVPGIIPPYIKRPGREADHSPPSSAKIKNAWSYTSTPQYASLAWCSVNKKHRDNFIFTIP
jgi:hypothetical protein